MPPDKKGGASNDKKATELLVFLLIGLFLAVAIINALLNYMTGLGLGSYETIWSMMASYFLENIWPIWKLAAAILSALSIVGIVYSLRKLGIINREESKIYNPPPEKVSQGELDEVQNKNDKWENILKLFNSDNPSNWRQAIISADVMLEELVRSLGYTGESLGEMLKSVDRNDFLTLDDAWEAHKVRNAIAHSGPDFQLTEREARRIMALYENVFKEFQVI